MTAVRWTDQAVEDLRSIREFIARDSPQYGQLVAERLFEATSRLEEFPESGRRVPDLDRDDVRELIVGDYRIVSARFGIRAATPRQFLAELEELE